MHTTVVAAMVDSHGEAIYPLLHRQRGEKGSACGGSGGPNRGITTAPPSESAAASHPSPDSFSVHHYLRCSAPQTSTSLQVEPSLTTSAPRRRTQAAVAAMVDSHGEVIYPLLHRQRGEKGSARVVEVAVPI